MWAETSRYLLEIGSLISVYHTRIFAVNRNKAKEDFSSLALAFSISDHTHGVQPGARVVVVFALVVVVVFALVVV